MQIENLRKLFVQELADIYDAEHQLVDALQELSRSAKSSKLKRAFDEHRTQTQGQIQRLERVFSGLGEEARRKPCEGIKGLLEEGKELMKAEGEDAAIDAALIGAAQKVEHYEIAAYGTLRTFAATLGRRDEAKLLQQTLDEEAAADEKLSDLAVSTVNPQATEGNGETEPSQGRLAGLLAALGIYPRGRSARATNGATKRTGGAKKGRSASSRGAAKSGARKSAAKKSAANKPGAKKSGAKKAARRSAAKKGGAKKMAANKRAAKRTAGARKATKRSPAARGGARKIAAKRSSGARQGATKRRGTT